MEKLALMLSDAPPHGDETIGHVSSVTYRPWDSATAYTTNSRCRWILRTVLEIVRKAAEQKGFAVIPRRWVVERSLAWLAAHRRLAPTTNATRHLTSRGLMIDIDVLVRIADLFRFRWDGRTHHHRQGGAAKDHLVRGRRHQHRVHGAGYTVDDLKQPDLGIAHLRTHLHQDVCLQPRWQVHRPRRRHLGRLLERRRPSGTEPSVTTTVTVIVTELRAVITG